MSGLHFGTYDYTAALGISPAHQAMDHPVAEHAKHVMAVAAAQTGVRLSDGSTNILPVGDTAQVHRAWAMHAGLVRRSLERGLYQGWDLHPAQLPTRFATTYLFFRSGLDRSLARLAVYLGVRFDAVGLPRRTGHGPGTGRVRPARHRLWCGRRLASSATCRWTGSRDWQSEVRLTHGTDQVPRPLRAAGR